MSSCSLPERLYTIRKRSESDENSTKYTWTFYWILHLMQRVPEGDGWAATIMYTNDLQRRCPNFFLFLAFMTIDGKQLLHDTHSGITPSTTFLVGWSFLSLWEAFRMIWIMRNVVCPNIFSLYQGQQLTKKMKGLVENTDIKMKTSAAESHNKIGVGEWDSAYFWRLKTRDSINTVSTSTGEGPSRSGTAYTDMWRPIQLVPIPVVFRFIPRM